MLVVDRVEVGSSQGCVTVRVGDVEGDPVGIVVPGESVPGLLDTVDRAILEAEDQYWDVVVPYVRSVGAADQEEVARALSAWHREQRWEQAAMDAPAEDVMFLLSNAGHVAVGANPPASPIPVLAIFDPLQLRRISPAIRAASRQAVLETATRPALLRVRAAHEVLGARPWRESDSREASSQAEASADIKARYTAHVRRSPRGGPA